MKYSVMLAALLLASTEITDLHAQEAPSDNTEQAQSESSESMMGGGMGSMMGGGMGSMMGHGMGVGWLMVGCVMACECVVP